MKVMKNRICLLCSLMSDIIYQSQSINIILKHANGGTLQEKHQLTFRDAQMDGTRNTLFPTSLLLRLLERVITRHSYVPVSLVLTFFRRTVLHLWIFQLNTTSIAWILEDFPRLVISGVEDVVTLQLRSAPL